jgi:predicted molibdopterin-dependent oxidoreductase YjgC
MSKPFRFTARPWELIKTPSVCSLCSVGCNLREDVRENKLLRVVGLENPAVNDGWLCDRGQFGYDYINSPDRVKAPMIRRDNGQLEETSWDEALNLIAERLKGVMANGSAFAALGSDRASNEDNFALQRFTREVMASPNIDHRMGGTGSGYAARRPQPGAIEALPKADVVLILASDLTAEAPVLDLVLKRSLLPKQMKAIVAYPRATALDKFSHQQLRYTPGQETALVNALVKATAEEGIGEAAKAADASGYAAATQGLGSVADLAAAAGLTEAEVRAAARSFAGAKLGSIIYGQAVAESSQGAAFLAAVQNLALIAGQAGKPGHVRLEAVQNANSWGARDMGVLPDTLPGGGAPKQKGMTTGEILAAAGGGKLQALWVMQSNPAIDFPDAAKAKKALESVPFLVVTDLFLTETAELAHVILPVVSVAERNCTLTNVEGRVQKAVRAMDPRGAAKEDWKILTMLAEDLGSSLGYSTAEAVGKDVRAAYSGAAAAPAPAMAKAEAPAAAKTGGDLPLALFTGKLMFDRSTIQGRSTVLPGLAPDPFVELHEVDAKRVGISSGDRVEVATAQGALKTTAKVSASVAPGSAFVPLGYNATPVSALLTEGATAVPCRITVSSKAAPVAAGPAVEATPEEPEMKPGTPSETLPDNDGPEREIP